MTTYHEMVRRVERYLKENPNLESITVRRPPKPRKPRVYGHPNDESYGRMPESCPIVRDILRRHLPDNDELQQEIFNDIYENVTKKFRFALEEALEQKFELLRVLDRIRDNVDQGRQSGWTQHHDQPPEQEEVHDKRKPVYTMAEEDDEE